MKIRHVNPTYLDAVELPRLVRLGTNIYGAAFFLMKLLPARFIIEKARKEGRIRPDEPVIETTSGTFGLALAMLCNHYHYRLILVSDPAIDPPLRRRLEDLGATVEIVEQPASVGGYQGARLARMAQLQAQYPDHFWPSQYDNSYNPGAYAPLAELLVEAIGHIDCLVGTVGSGGSMCGTSTYLRVLFPHLYTVGVDTHGSVLFGQPDQKRILRGLGNSLMPKNVDHTVFDEVHWVGAAEGFLATRELHRQYGLYMGPTSGTAYFVARWWAQQHPDTTVVVLFPDEGYRYQETVYNDEWLRAQRLTRSALPEAPHLTDHPHATESDWSYYRWSRRTYEQVLGGPFEPNSE